MGIKMGNVSRQPRVRNCEHLVQFYGEDVTRLARNVARYLRDSLSPGGAGIVIASDSRREAIVRELERLQTAGEAPFQARLMLIDDAEALATFMHDGMPDAELFEAHVGSLAKDLHGQYGRVRAYGEMVGRLWIERAYSAAIELEVLWNDLLDSVGFDLYCGYPIDVLSEDFQIPAMRPLLAAHSRLVPALSRTFDAAVRRAMDDVLGNHPYGLQALAHEVFHSLETSLPSAEGTILRLRSALPRYADEILAKAREYQQA